VFKSVDIAPCTIREAHKKIYIPPFIESVHKKVWVCEVWSLEVVIMRIAFLGDVTASSLVKMLTFWRDMVPPSSEQENLSFSPAFQEHILQSWGTAEQ
jgi:hypothetical protein